MWHVQAPKMHGGHVILDEWLSPTAASFIGQVLVDGEAGRQASSLVKKLLTTFRPAIGT
jgi:hypothetical protein